ncbi:MAG: hypothetical protein RBT80_27770, partial [Candidatus Vecturithrix sp.]|jgi:predicted RND superfamily exporter protein|nr:hypothetical protein [Candidatus Vecturithrix sp.]
MMRTFHTTGRGIVFNAFSVIIGFAALLFSSFLPVRFFGLLMVVMILACLIGGMLLIPALCMVLRPRFLEFGAVSETTHQLDKVTFGGSSVCGGELTES